MTSKLRPALLLTLVAFASLMYGQNRADFSGTWKLDGTKSIPPRKTEATLGIVLKDPLLSVETIIAGGKEGTRHAVQHYSIDGKTSVSTGADGDEFHTTIVWKGETMAFSITEYEDGSVKASKETWSLKEDGKVLVRLREMPDGKQQTLIYLKQP